MYVELKLYINRGLFNSLGLELERKISDTGKNCLWLSGEEECRIGEFDQLKKNVITWWLINEKTIIF